MLSRTIANRGDGNSLGMPRQRMEFLIDRFGYIRARWVPEDEPEGWQSLERVRQQAERLNQEPRIRASARRSCPLEPFSRTSQRRK